MNSVAVRTGDGETPVQTPRKGQLGSKKSHNGCVTCKIRRVKCDESRPACKRCLSTGRKCDGYANNNESKNKVRSVSQVDMPIIRSAVGGIVCPTIDGNVTQAEVRSFEFFMQRVVPGFTQIVDQEFWHCLIPQLSRSDPVIWNAVNALSCLIQYRQYSSSLVLLGSKKTPVENDDHRRALRWYNKSITGLQKRMSQEMTWSAVLNITCVLYICIECLQDNIAEAVILYHRAVSMLGLAAEVQQGQRSKSPSRMHVEHTTRALLRHMAVSYGQPIHQSKIMCDPVERKLRLLSDAKDEIYMILSEANEFLQFIETIKLAHGKDWKPSPEMYVRQNMLETRFLRWRSAVETVREDATSTPQPNDDEMYSVSMLVYNHHLIWLSTCLSMDEIAYDSCFDMFQSMVDHAARIVATSSVQSAPVFVFETRVIPSLFYVAFRCRHPIIRRDALKLLRNGPQVENIWKAEPMANNVERTIGIEESGDINGVFRLEALDMALPPENYRVCGQLVVELPGPGGDLVQFLKVGRWEQDVNLHWARVEYLLDL